jgi:hypothetical protein
MGRVVLFSISNLCLALVVVVWLAAYTAARTEAAGVGAVSAPAEKVPCYKIVS